MIFRSKNLALNALTQVEVREWSNIKNLLIVSVTPGLCATDLARGVPNSRSPELGADSVLYVVNTPRNELENGGFYLDGQQLPLISAPLPKN
jgi:hypothetical protein